MSRKHKANPRNPNHVVTQPPALERQVPDARVVYRVKIEPDPDRERRDGEQARLLKRQIRISKVLNWITAAAAAFALYMGYLQFQESHKNFMSDQRPWLGITDIGLTLQTDKPLNAMAHLTNTGKSPAFDVEVDYSLLLRDTSVNVAEYMKSPGRAQPADTYSMGILFPNSPSATLQAGVPQKPSENFINRVATHQQFIYFFGTIAYRDSFSVHHTTKFCWEWHAEGGFTPCDKFENYAD